MASEKVTALVEQVKELTVLELSELVHTLEEVFGVSGFDSFLPVARSREDALALLPE